MNMKLHILTALQDQFTRWEDLLANLTEEKLVSASQPANWSIRDVIAHLWAWQQRSLARLEAAVHNREPGYPRWPPELDPDSEADTDRINAWIYRANQERSWLDVYQDWRHGFLGCLEAANKIPEKDLLDGGRYAWLKGQSLASILIASYDHHQEHFEKVLGWLSEPEAAVDSTGHDQMLFAVIRTRGPAWKSGSRLEEQQAWDAHARFMDDLEARGIVIMGGPLEGTSDVLLVMRAKSAEEITKLHRDDPWTVLGLLQGERIMPWTLRLGALPSAR
jgi:uncharacterized protein YciI